MGNSLSTVTSDLLLLLNPLSSIIPYVCFEIWRKKVE